MKIYSILSLILFLILIIFPLITLNYTDSKDSTNIKTEKTAEQSYETNEMIKVVRTSSGIIEKVKLKEYLIGCVACEMPATFHEEALKAQCVASYTYLKWILNNADNPMSDITDNSNTHQGYLNENELKEIWGDKFNTYYQKISSAVTSVEGEYIIYDGETIQAVFHAISPGMTNAAKDVWGNEIPYLKRVNAPGDKLSADYENEFTYTVAEIRKRISALEENDLNSIKDNELIRDIKHTDNNYVNEITLGTVKTSGNEARSILGLYSPNFKISFEKNKYKFTVIGKGHGVGMSQYSADFMARQGSDYKEILKHFYSGISLEKD